MTPEQSRYAVLGALAEIAPEADLSALPEDADMREWLDIDSLDFLNVVIAINERTGVEIPERDYPRLVTLADCVTYLSGVTA